MSYRREHGRVPSVRHEPVRFDIDYTLMRQSMEADSFVEDTAEGPVIV